MDILTIKEASLMWGISVRRITVLCNEGRIVGAKKIAGAWLLPKDAEKPADARIKSGKITYAEAEFDSRTRIYQSVTPSFNPDLEYLNDPLSREIPSVDNSLFILARKLILEIK